MRPTILKQLANTPKNGRHSSGGFLKHLRSYKRASVVFAAFVVCATLTATFFYNRAFAASTYTWNQTGTASWATAANWTPARTTPAVDDILVFNNAATTTVTNVPTQTIGQLSVSGNTTVNLQAAAAVTLTIAGGSGTDLDVQAGSALNCNTINAITIAVGTGATGSISGSMTFSAGASTAHRLTAADASAITFNSGATFTAGTNFNGNAFGTTNLNSVVFANGSTYVLKAGANPFGAGAPNSVVVFQTGSLYSQQNTAGLSASGRTYANFELNAAGTTNITGGNAFVVDNLTITLGTLGYNMTATPGHSIKGNISVASGATLNFNPASAGTVNFNGSSAQTITNSGTLTFAALQSIVIANTNGVTVNSAVTLPGTTTINSGATLAVGATLTNSGTMNVNGAFQINQGGFATGTNFVYAAGATLVFNNNAGSFGVNADPYWPTSNGPQNVTVQNTGGITMNVARTVGTLFQYAAGVSGAGNLTLNGTSQVNNGGFTSGSPTYGAASLLKYNIKAAYGRNGEWLPNVTTGAGYPANVQLSNNTNLDLPNGSAAAFFQMGGNLTIDPGSTMNLDGSPAMTQPLNVVGNVNINGTLTLSTASGGDIHTQGNWADAGTFTPNTRAVFFDGSAATQTISKATGETFNYLVINKSAGSVQLLNDVVINGTVGNALQLLGGNFDLNLNTLRFTGNGGNILASGGARTIDSNAPTSFIFFQGSKSISSAAGGTLIFGANTYPNLSAAVDFGANVTTINGPFSINAGGSVSTNAPTYGAGSSLLYNTGGTFGRSTEWTGTTASTFPSPGYPNNVVVSNNTTLDMGANGGTALSFAANGSLNTTSGSTFTMAVTPMTVLVNIKGDVNNSGTTTLSTTSGGDLKLQGSLINQTGGTYNFNNRAVSFEGGATQNITDFSGAISIPYVIINKSGGTVALNGADLTTLGPSGGNSLSFSTATSTLTLNARTLTLGSTVPSALAGAGLITNPSANLILNDGGSTGDMGTIPFSGAASLANLTVNRTTATGNVTLGAALTVANALTLTAGKVTTSSSNLLTVTNTAASAISGGGSSTYVNGPLARRLPASLVSGSTYSFPVGKGGFNPFELVNPTTTGGGTVTIQAEEFDGNSGGTAGSGLSALNTNRYWNGSITANSANFTNTTVRLTDSGLTASNRIGKSATQGGTYDSIGGTVAGSTITSDPITTFSFFNIGTSGAVCVTPTTVYVDDSWVGTPIGTDPDGGGPATNFGCDSFATIQEGVNAVPASGTVVVNDGTYTENVTISKVLTLKGAQFGVDARGRVAAESTVSPAVAGSATFLLNTTTTATVVDGFSFTGGTSLGVIQTQSGADFSNLQIRNNRFSGYSQAAVFMNRGGSDITIDKNVMDGSNIVGSGQAIFGNGPQNFNGLFITNNNIINNNGRYGFFVDGNHNVGESAARAALISGNLFDNNLQSLNLGSRSMGTLGAPVLGTYAGTISNNTFSNNTANGIQAGIQHVLVSGNTFSGNATDGLALTSFGNTGADRGAQNSLITGNTFTTSGRAGIFFSGTQGVGLIETNHANFNRIFGNAVGVQYGASVAAGNNATIDVENNWWGCNFGPGATGAGCGAAANGTLVFAGNTGVLDSDPWIVLGTSASPNPIGPGGSSTVTADMTHNSNAAAPGGGTVPLIPVSFSATNGTMSPPTGTITAGQATSTFTSNSLSSGTACSMVDNQQICTNITVTLPSFTIDDVTHNEGNAGTTAYTFTITKNGSTTFNSSVDYATVNGTATAPSDFTAIPTTTVQFLPADTSKQVTVLVNGDTTFEPNEAFTVHLSNPVSATITDADGTGTITNDDPNPPVITITPAVTPTAADNDYTRINNAVQATFNGQTIKLLGTFDWTEANAAASWALGSDGIGGTLDDYSILVPANINNVTFTADNLGDGTIQGPGDLPGLDLEGVFFFDSLSGSKNQSWTISNIRFLDFDLSIGMFQDTGGAVDAFNNTHLTNNYIRMARDVATPTDTAQNIAIHYSFGTNQVISGNTIDIQGDGVSVAGNNAADVGMQSNTSGGNAYNGLQITNNTIHVLNAQSANPEVILGIWENGHAHSSNITVSGNTFTNQGAGNNTATNLQRGFRVTSHSSATTTVTYQNNTVSGANIGFQWIAGSAFGANQPVVVKSNTITGNGTGVLVQSQGVANLSFNRIVGNTVTGLNNVDGSVTAENNWWGCNAGPGNAGCDAVTGVADFNPWIVLGVSASPNPINPFGNSTVTADMRFNSDAVNTSGSGTIPPTPVTWSATNGTMAPPAGTVTAGTASSTFTSNSASSGTGCAMVDNQLICTPILVVSPVNVSLPHVTGPTLSSITVPMTVSDLTGKGVKSYDCQITFNAAVVQPQAIPFDTTGTLSSGMTVTSNITNMGHLIINASQATDLSGSGTLINLKFTIVGAPGQVTPTTFEDYTDPGSTFHPGFQFNTGAPVANTSNGSIHVNGPTAASGAVSGRITDQQGQPISGTTVTVSGGPGLIRAITDAAGFYRVAGLPVNNFYTVTPSRANFGFAPANRSFSLVADRTDAVFTGQAVGPDANPLESPEFFVRQQYVDFLSREPDQDGLDYWSGQLRACGTDLNCLRARKIEVSAAFFMSVEFQQSGDYIYRLYRAALGRQLTYAEFTSDHQRVIGGADLEALRTQFAEDFVQRPEFVAKYQSHVLAETFVDALLQGILADTQVDLSSRRAALIASYNSGGDLNHSRSAVLSAVAERAEFRTKVYNSSFVLMEYFGYLQRDMDADGFAFWVNVLTNGGGGDQGKYRGMVCSFTTSAEYQRRFSPLVVHTNAECAGQ